MPRLSSSHSRWRGQAPSTASRGAVQQRSWLGFRDPPGHCALSVQAHSCCSSQQPRAAPWAAVVSIRQVGTVRPGNIGVSPKAAAPELEDLGPRSPDSRPAASPTAHTLLRSPI